LAKTMSGKSSIDILFSDSGPFDENEAAKALHAHITIQRATKRIYLKNSDISVDKKILAYCLAKKMLRMKGLIDEEMVTAREFHEMTGIKKGSIDPAFKLLKDKGLLVGKGEYEISMHKISQIIEMLSDKK